MGGSEERRRLLVLVLDIAGGVLRQTQDSPIRRKIIPVHTELTMSN